MGIILVIPCTDQQHWQSIFFGAIMRSAVNLHICWLPITSSLLSSFIVGRMLHCEQHWFQTEAHTLCIISSIKALSSAVHSGHCSPPPPLGPLSFWAAQTAASVPPACQSSLSLSCIELCLCSALSVSCASTSSWLCFGLSLSLAAPVSLLHLLHLMTVLSTLPCASLVGLSREVHFCCCTALALLLHCVLCCLRRRLAVSTSSHTHTIAPTILFQDARHYRRTILFCIFANKTETLYFFAWDTKRRSLLFIL